MGPDQRLARQHLARETDRVRPVLHRALVARLRPADPDSNPLARLPKPKRLLSPPGASEPTRGIEGCPGYAGVARARGGHGGRPEPLEPTRGIEGGPGYAGVARARGGHGGRPEPLDQRRGSRGAPAMPARPERGGGSGVARSPPLHQYARNGSVAARTRTKYSLKRSVSSLPTMSETRKHTRSPWRHTHVAKPESWMRTGRQVPTLTRARSGSFRAGAGSATYVRK